MDFSWSEEQRAIQGLARQIFEDHCTPERLAEIERASDGLDRELWSALARANLLGVALPEEFGGSSLGILELCLLLEEAGRALAPLPLWPVLCAAALPIAEFGTPDLRRDTLPRIASGELLLSAALSEVGGADSATPRTAAQPEGTRWRLDGEKVCVPAAHAAERILVPARTDAGVDGVRVGVILVDAHAAGAKLEPQTATNREPQFRLVLSGAEVAADAVLGDPREGAGMVRWIEERALVALCALQLGVAQEALRRTAEYTSSRRQFGRPLASFQGVALRAADAYIDIEAMRSTLWQAAWRLSAGLPASRQIAAAKWWACVGGQRVVHTAQHLHGGIGADVSYPIHRYFLWAKQLELTLGGAPQHLAHLGQLLAS